VKAALVCLAQQWPRALAFDELRRQARALLGRGSLLGCSLETTPQQGGVPDDPAQVEHDRRQLSQALLAAYAGASNALVELSLRPPRFAAQVSDRPEASRLARLQAAAGAQVTNLRHHQVNLSDFDRELLVLLDGRHSRAAQLAALLDRFRQGRLTLSRQGQVVREIHQARPILSQTLDQQLPRLADAALLVA
jgi:hypothetical protein